MAIKLACILLLLAATCSIDAAPFGRARSQLLSGSATLATFNTALTPHFPELESRTDILIQEILKSDVDIWCLQEIWYADIQRSIYNSVKDYYPHALSVVDLNTAPPDDAARACSVEMVQALGLCVQTKCGGVSGKQQAACIVLSCGDVITTTLSVPCRQCILNSMDFTTAANCATEPASRYAKTYGLLMLSKWELTDTKVEGFTPQNQFRGLMQASVESVGNLICTHLTSYGGEFYLGPPVTSPLMYKTYAEQQYAELLHLFDIIVTLDEPILFGDFNHGPASPGNITWELPFHYGLMTTRGLTSPYVIKDGRCTWCGSMENAAAVTSFPFDEVIDHIYVPTDSFGRVESVERVFDTLTTSNGVPLSDHYGVKATLTNYARDCSWWQYNYFCKTKREDLLDLSPPQEQLGSLCAASA